MPLPQPGMYDKWSDWGSKLVSQLQQNVPTAILQLFTSPTPRLPNALPDGLFIYDSLAKQCLVSKAGHWVAISDADTPAPAPSFLPWVLVTTNSQQMVSNKGYIANSPSTVQFTLPVSSNFGDIIRIGGMGAGGWQLNQGPSQAINYGDDATSQGPAGSLASQNAFDSVELVCITANQNWLMLSSQGNITVT